MSTKKRIFVIATCIIVVAVIIVVCVRLFTGDKSEDFDGTLVKSWVDTVGHFII